MSAYGVHRIRQRLFPPSASGWRTAWLAMLGLTGLSCSVAPKHRYVRVEDVEAGARVRAVPLVLSVAADAGPLRSLCVPLSEGLSLLQVTNATDWGRLQPLVPQLGQMPDFRSGAVVGLVCWSGTPIGDPWPIEVIEVRALNGAGVLRASFAGGTFLPDGTARVAAVYAPDVLGVLVVDVDGERYYPQTAPGS